MDCANKTAAGQPRRAPMGSNGLCVKCARPQYCSVPGCNARCSIAFLRQRLCAKHGPTTDSKAAASHSSNLQARKRRNPDFVGESPRKKLVCSIEWFVSSGIVRH